MYLAHNFHSVNGFSTAWMYFIYTPHEQRTTAAQLIVATFFLQWISSKSAVTLSLSSRWHNDCSRSSLFSFPTLFDSQQHWNGSQSVCQNRLHHTRSSIKSMRIVYVYVWLCECSSMYSTCFSFQQKTADCAAYTHTHNDTASSTTLNVNIKHPSLAAAVELIHCDCILFQMIQFQQNPTKFLHSKQQKLFFKL